MSLSHEGFPLVIGATVLAVITYALALRLRSWPLWLTAFAFTLLVLGIAWAFRAPRSATVSLSSPSPIYPVFSHTTVCGGVHT